MRSSMLAAGYVRTTPAVPARRLAFACCLPCRLAHPSPHPAPPCMRARCQIPFVHAALMCRSSADAFVCPSIELLQATSGWLSTW